MEKGVRRGFSIILLNKTEISTCKIHGTLSTGSNSTRDAAHEEDAQGEAQKHEGATARRRTSKPPRTRTPHQEVACRSRPARRRHSKKAHWEPVAHKAVAVMIQLSTALNGVHDNEELHHDAQGAYDIQRPSERTSRDGS